jgi:hypothetical protein
MSSRGERFITEDVWDYLEDNYPQFKFNHLEVPKAWYDISDCEFPDSVEIKAFEDEKFVGTVKVNIKFEIEEYLGTKYIAAYVKDVQILKNPKKEVNDASN